MRPVLLIIAFASFIWSSRAQESLHSWLARPSNLSVYLNRDESKMAVVSYDHVTIWDTSSGALMRNVALPSSQEGKPVSEENFEAVGISPDFDRLLYKVAGNYAYFSIKLGMPLLFPGFDGADVTALLGFEHKGWLLYTSKGFRSGLFAAFRDGEFSFNEAVSRGGLSNYLLSKDHTYLVYENYEGKLTILNLKTKAIEATKIKSPFYLRDQGLPDGIMTVYGYDKNKPEGEKVTWRYFLNLKDGEPGRKLKGEPAQSHYPSGLEIPEKSVPAFCFGSSPDFYYEVLSGDSFAGKKAYVIYKRDRKTRNMLLSLNLMQAKEVQQQQDDTSKKQEALRKKAEKEQLDALKSTYFRDFVAQFPVLPTTQIVDYDRVRGIDITAKDYVKNFIDLRPGESLFSLGRLASCEDGSYFLLMMYRFRKNSDQSHYYITHYDASGKALQSKRVGYLERLKGEVVARQNFGFQTNQKNFNVLSVFENQGGKPDEARYADGCSSSF